MKIVMMITSLLTLFGCGSQTKDEQISRLLEQGIANASKAPSRLIELSKVNAVEWDHAEVFPPYTPLESLPEKVRGDQRANTSGIDSRDDISLIVFFSHGAISSIVAFPRSILDFAPIATKLISPSDCISINGDSPPKASLLKNCGT
jgi:hypothetical protein